MYLLEVILKIVFLKKITFCLFEHLNKDFIKKFPKNISAPAPYLFDKGVSQIIKKSDESRYVKEIDWDNRYAFQL